MGQRSPSCACCGICDPSCTVYEDLFANALADYTAVGSWSTGDGRAISVGSGSLIRTADHPHGTSMRVEAVIYTALGQRHRVIANVSDNDNYLAAELETFSNYVKVRLIERVAGADSVLGMIVVGPRSPGDSLMLSICHGDYELGPRTTVKLYGHVQDTTYATLVSGVAQSGVRAGLAAAGSGTHTFEELRVFAVNSLTTDLPACVIESPTFTTLPAEWEQVSGTWSAAAGALTTSSPFGKILTRTSPVWGVVIQVTVQLGQLIDTAVVISNYQDANNYKSVQISASGSQLRVAIYNRVGGSETLGAAVVLAGTSATSVRSYTIYACGDALTVHVDVPSGYSPYTAITHTRNVGSGRRVGLGGGGAVFPMHSFSAFTTYHHRSANHLLCPSPDFTDECEQCEECESHVKITASTTAAEGDPYEWAPQWTASEAWQYTSVAGTYSGRRPFGGGTLVSQHDLSHRTDTTYVYSLGLSFEIPPTPADIATLSRLRMAIDADDADNGLFVEIDFTIIVPGFVVVRYGEVNGGVDTIFETVNQRTWNPSIRVGGDASSGYELGMIAINGSTIHGVAITPRGGSRVAIIVDGEIPIHNPRIYGCSW